MPALMTNSRITLLFDHGEDESGEVIMSRKHFNNVRPEAENESILAVVEALAPLQQHDLAAVTRTNEYDLN